MCTDMHAPETTSSNDGEPCSSRHPELIDTFLSEDCFPEDGLTKNQRRIERADLAHVMGQFLAECNLKIEMEIMLGLLTSFCSRTHKRAALQRLQTTAKQLGIEDFNHIKQIEKSLSHFFVHKNYSSYWVERSQLTAENPDYEFIDLQVEAILAALGANRRAPVVVEIGMQQSVEGPYCNLARRYDNGVAPLGDHLEIKLFFVDHTLPSVFLLVQFNRATPDGRPIRQALNPNGIFGRGLDQAASALVLPHFENAWQFVCVLIGRLNVEYVSTTYGVLEDVD